MEPNTTTEQLGPAQPLGAATASRRGRAHLAGASELRDALEAIELFSHEARGFLSRQAKERPHTLLACAAGVGFVLGGGLASRTGALLARAGARLVMAHVLQALVGNPSTDKKTDVQRTGAPETSLK